MHQAFCIRSIPGPAYREMPRNTNATATWVLGNSQAVTNGSSVFFETDSFSPWNEPSSGYAGQVEAERCKRRRPKT
ncbi:uncharacterized protein ZHAS_00013530 [Anopheles sinensis]|uniref:Uncharacterized protein n=1 Tax=Anopheles sinensis TaxID=74873 RepID=A0A084W627_ANOSI|nr:uncharacterized protein ZHAS_00013530 [Anopheles sinensis]